MMRTMGGRTPTELRMTASTRSSSSMGRTNPAKPRHDGGKKCLCDKPAAEHMDHPWKITRAGRNKFCNQRNLCDLRNPGCFSMYTFNDHVGYGVLEVLQNLMLDYEEAAESSEILNIGTVMALFIMYAVDAREYGLLEESKAESLGPAMDKKKWHPHEFASYILAYVRKYDIELMGPSKIAQYIKDVEADVALSDTAPNTASADVWGFAKALKAYTTREGNPGAYMAGRREHHNSKIGGDSLDLTTWTSAERKAKSFKRKDPFGKAEIDAIKRGDVLSMG
ncbi:hypothetical protein B0H63DRAFT_456767 [Podospora didyma]|uniref:Uncharacterized protein n=1 Tax=Podospora didyma TaxID=330526 RepID=A0AAE0U746_9PEZI|nr:hypothetical protein B0H63DRAFT_456767 [Podospora didyma]